ncbi:hypothetical protein [Micromonospora arida]
MLGGEVQHEKGRKGVYFSKKWLEYTTRCNVPWVVYEAPTRVGLLDLAGKHDSYDLAGHFIEPPCKPFFVEVKTDSTVGKQPAKYLEYLAHSYSATKRAIDEKLDRENEFMWVTWHPFSQSDWRDLCAPATIVRALTEYPAKLAGQEIDHDVVKLVSKRLWLIVISDRHEELLMSPQHYAGVQAIIAEGR